MASGNTLVVLKPYDNEPPATLYALLDWRPDGGTPVGQQPFLSFSGTVDWEAHFSGIVPSHYAGGGFTVILHWAFTSATSGTANVEVSVERGTTDKDAASFATMTDGSVVPNGTVGIETKQTVILANMDSIVAGDHFRLKVRRDADGTNGTDDIATVMELYSIEIRET